MEFKKKTIIWEDNNEPPKDYIGAKKDGKFYEYSYATRSGVESKSISGGSEGSGGSGDDGGGGSIKIDYEAIYQFYKKKVIETIPEESLEEAIIPEHYADIESGIEFSEEYRGKTGIWYSDSINYNLTENDIELFCEISTIPFPSVVKRIYFGTYKVRGV